MDELIEEGFWASDPHNPGAYVWWTQENDGEYYHQDSLGTFWAWSETDAWNAVLWSSPEEAQPVVEAYAAYEEKMRSFQDSRRAAAAKNASRGFYPKGKFKGKSSFGGLRKGKGKGFGGRPSFSSSPPSVSPVLAVSGGKPGSPSYTGCFICGDKSHDFRSCPRRSKTGKGSGSGGKVFMIDSMDAHEVNDGGQVEETFVCHPWSSPANPLSILTVGTITSPEQDGVGVLDTGATETVAGLGALERIMFRRKEAGCSLDDFQVVDLPNKWFRFGNGMVQKSESMILLPQRLGAHQLSLGIYTLEAEGVPVLVGIRTLSRLGALLDCSRSALVLTAIDASLLIPLRKSSSGHLLMDLSHDWLTDGSKILFTSETSDRSQYGVPAAPSCFMVENEELPSSSPLPLSALSVESFLHEHELSQLHQLHGEHAEEFLSSCFAVRFSSPSSTCLNENACLTDLQAQRQEMSLRALTLLAASSVAILTPSSNGPAGIESSGVFGQVVFGDQAEEESRSAAGRALRHFEDGAGRSSGPPHTWTAMHGSPHSGGSLQGLGDGLQRPCQMDGMQCLSSAPGVHPCIRGHGSAPSGRSSPRGHQEAGGRVGGESTRQSLAEEPSHWFGRRREVCAGDTFHQRDGVHSHLGSSAFSHGCGGAFSSARPKDQEGGASSGGSGVPGGSTARRIVVASSDLSEHSGTIPVTSNVDIGGDFEEKNMNETFAATANVPVNSNTKHSKDVRFLKNAQVPPNVQVPDNAFLSVNDRVKAQKETFEEPFYQDAFEPMEEDLCRLTPKEMTFMTEAVGELMNECDSVLVANGGLSYMEHWDVLELCCSPGSELTEAVLRAGGRGGRAGLHNGCDLTKQSGVDATLELLRLHRPRWIWVSFPCGPTSMVQALNERTEAGRQKSLYRKRHARKVLRGGLQVLHEHLKNDGEIGWEWPRYNRAWRLPEVEGFWAFLKDKGMAHETLGDGCMLGLTSEQGPVKKPWRFMCTREGALADLGRLCDGSHHHVPCLGSNARKSAFYTPQLCHLAAKGMLKHSMLVGGIQEEEDPDTSVLSKLTPQELQHLMETVRKLHRLCGHPNRRAMLKLLRARGASDELKAAASQLVCPDCVESQTATPLARVTLEREEFIWKTLQMDSFHFRHAHTVHHFLLLLDEASSFAVVKEIMNHPEDQSENISTAEVIETLEESWRQIFGFPSKIRCDAEGAFRGTDLARWCAERGVELLHTPAEHHSSTGAVEKAIGELRHKMETFLRHEPGDPKRAAFAMVSAHNHVTRVGGYAPSQWAFGRADLPDKNVAISCTEGIAGHAMAENLRLRQEAEHLHNKLTAASRISRAQNTRSRPVKQFIPGDTVFYQRHKTPKQAPANADVDVPRMRIARWFGPARVLACETRATTSSRSPSTTVWLVAGGRLLKTHCDQVRHASETELLIANASQTVAMPWTFNMVSNTLNKGAFEDLTASRAERFEHKRRQTFRPSRTPKKLRTDDDQGDPSESEAMGSDSSEELIPDASMAPGLGPDDSEELDVDRLLNDPSYLPLHPLEPPGEPPGSSKRPERSMKWMIVLIMPSSLRCIRVRT